MVTVISEQEFDTVVMGITILLAVATGSDDEQKREEACTLVVKGLALLKAGVFQ